MTWDYQIRKKSKDNLLYRIPLQQKLNQTILNTSIAIYLIKIFRPNHMILELSDNCLHAMSQIGLVQFGQYFVYSNRFSLLVSTNMTWRAVVDVYLIIIQTDKNFRVNRSSVFYKVFKKRRTNCYNCFEAYIVFFCSVSGHRLCFLTAFWDFNVCYNI